MIRPLRRRHALFALGLGTLVPLGFVLGVLARTAPAVTESLPEALREPLDEVPAGSQSLGLFVVELEGSDYRHIASSVWASDEGLWLQLSPVRDPQLPNVLVYWTAAEQVPQADGLPQDSVLVGSLAGAAPRQFRLPASAADGGRVVLYSLGHQSVLSSAPMPRD